MKTNKPLFFLLLSICFSTNIFSQYYYYNDDYYDNDIVVEVGAGIGAMNSVTDVGGGDTEKRHYINEIRRSNFKVSNSIYAGLMYQNFLGARLEATWGNVQSADNQVKGISGNQISIAARNLNFRSSILEIALVTELHPLMLLNYKEAPPLLSPYLTAGVGWFSFNPQTLYKGRWIDLKPLHTEGQGFPEYPTMHEYSLSAVNIPAGFGVRYEVSSLFNLRLEYVHRFLFTDYLDDASSKKYINPAAFAKNLSPIQAAYARALHNPSTSGKVPARRGNPNNNDSYMAFSFKIGLVLGRERVH
ncbi:MAG: hypothetical protein JWQ40_1812 [Segetibacter sp.]|nr:hypothetical protein [Segetibacter sp.]